MSTTALYVAARSHGLQRLCDYLQLTKLKIVLLELVTVSVAAVLAASGLPHPGLLACALAGTALVAAGASVFNQCLERRSDARMQRTADRPLPAGRLGIAPALVFGAALTLAGIVSLACLVNPLTALLGLLTWLFYVGLYTPLKSRTAANTAVGAVAGAMPVLMGWSAAEGTFGLAAATLFMIVFLWQFPHFMAIAWIYRRQYAAAGMQMLSVVDPSGRRAGRQALFASLALLPVSLLPAVLGLAPAGYFFAALFLSAFQLACAAWFFHRLSDDSARLLLRASLIYLPAVLAGLLIGPLL